MSGKRDFSKLNAKLEKHIERLPDYAQRAQDTLRRYLPADGQGQASASDRQQPASRPSTPPVPSTKLPVPIPVPVAELPVVEQVRAKWANWNDPAAKLVRRRRRTSRAVTLWIVLSLLCTLYAVAVLLGIGQAAGLAAVGFAGTAVFGALSVRSGVRLRQLNRTPLPAAQPAPPRLPRAGSNAREPMRRLTEAESSLAELLAQLGTPTAAGTTAVSEIAIADARITAADAAGALRHLADRIQSIERARDTTSASQRSALDSAIRALCDQLEDGLDGYSRLVAVAGRAIAASGSEIAEVKQSVTDAIDHLAGLAIALREAS